MAKASIIIPIYNVEKYVCKCIESVINQTEKDIEILLVDDGSTDSSGKICDEYAELDQRVRVIHKENGGLSSARNCGTEHATSEYIQFLDGDDFLRADAVEVLYSTMQQYPCDFVQFMYQEVNENEEPVKKVQSEKIYQAHTSKELFENLYRLGGVAASGATKFMRRELALRIPFENIRHEDEMWCTRAFQKDLTVTYIPDELYYYVMREGSIIHSGFNKKKLDLLRIHDLRYQVLHEFKYVELEKKELEKIFMTHIILYIDAKRNSDLQALNALAMNFFQYRKALKNVKISMPKFDVLKKFMCYNYKFITIYWLLCKMMKNDKY